MSGIKMWKVTKMLACGARAAGQHKPKICKPSKTQVSLHLCVVLPESLSAAVYEPRTQGFFSEDADQTA